MQSKKVFSKIASFYDADEAFSLSTGRYEVGKVTARDTFVIRL